MVKPNGTKIPNITKTTHACKHATLKDKMEIKENFKNSFPPMKETLPETQGCNFTYQQKKHMLWSPHTPYFLFHFFFSFFEGFDMCR
jgi:hypothetical protein